MIKLKTKHALFHIQRTHISKCRSYVNGLWIDSHVYTYTHTHTQSHTRQMLRILEIYNTI